MRRAKLEFEENTSIVACRDSPHLLGLGMKHGSISMPWKSNSVPSGQALFFGGGLGLWPAIVFDV